MDQGQPDLSQPVRDVSLVQDQSQHSEPSQSQPLFPEDDAISNDILNSLALKKEPERDTEPSHQTSSISEDSGSGTVIEQKTKEPEGTPPPSSHTGKRDSRITFYMPMPPVPQRR